MSNTTNIQWCDSTVNPIMGCLGCELFIAPTTLLRQIDHEIMEQTSAWLYGDAAQVISGMIPSNKFDDSDAKLTTTNIYHSRKLFLEWLNGAIGQIGYIETAPIEAAIERGVTCYAAKLHLNKAHSAFNPDRKVNPGYAPTFEELKQFPGRVAKMAHLSDLTGRVDPKSPWKSGLPRMVFVSDMGDAFSRKEDFVFLEKDVVPAIKSPQGSRHIWLWLTKRPQAMAHFAKDIGGLPDNVCAMTTLTCADPSNLRRIDQLRKVAARSRGLSIEPLRERINPETIDLDGIDWVIIGGESGAIRHVHPFHLEWAMELRDHCKAKGVAFFMKQFGRAPLWRGNPIKLSHTHGGNWDEWPQTPNLRIREFPRYFYDYHSSLPKR